MRWNRFLARGPAFVPTGPARPILAAVLWLTFALFLLGAPGSPRDEKLISIYSRKTNYTVALLERNGQDYVSLREVLDPLGKAGFKTDGLHWKVRYEKVEGEFTAGKTQTRIRGREFTLPAKFLLENGSGLVPLAALSMLLSNFLDTPLAYYPNSHRLFIGNIGVHFTAQVTKTNPATLVLNFSSPVNPTIATEPGKLRMVFTRDPLVAPGTTLLTFDSGTIPSAAYIENNGTAEIAVNGNVPLLASFSNSGRTITITPAPQSNRAAAPPAPLPGQISSQGSGQPVPGTSLPSSAPGAGGANPLTAQYFAVVDASHGGDERGAALADQLVEKDVTLAFARRVRQELAARGVSSLVIRDGDMTLSLDQRADLANTAHPAIYICIHATSQGTGVRVYTALLPAGGENRGPFLDWETAQSGYRASSQAAAAGLAAEFQRRQLPVRNLSTPLRPLNNIVAPAVAIEVAPPAAGLAQLNSAEYQQLVAEGIATGVTNLRGQLGAAH
jgi:N-acetylmuramoyl-L-alanine amidase